MTPKSVHRTGTAVLSLSMVVIGLVLIVQSASEGGGGVVVRLLLGALFTAAGCGRLYLLARKGRGT
ncbi:MAG: hypothetical protein ACTHM1_10930 [Solirubrobacteraceae bacterium]